jgi:MFS transporter, DHA1 family, multidrug resistance protein
VSRLFERIRAAEQLLVLCGATFLVMVGQGVVSPVLPLYAKNFGVGASMVGLTLTVFALARLILNLPAGLIADRYGRRVLLIGGPLITSIGMIGSGFADTIWTLLVWRFVAGAGSAFYMSGALIYLIDVAPPDRRARYVATNQWALSVGVAVGPGLGGLVAEQYGLSAPFHVVGGTAILASIYAAFRLPETRHLIEDAPPDATAGPRVSTWEFARSRRFLIVAVVTAAIFMARAGTRSTLFPLYAADELGWGPGEIGIVFTATAALTLVTLMPSAWAADNIGRRWVILFSGVCGGLGIVIAGATGAAAGFIVGNFVMSLGTGTAGPAPAAYVADIAPAHMRGMGIALYRSAGDVGFLAAPPLLGLLGEATSLTTAMLVSAGLLGGTAILFAIASRHDPLAGSQLSHSEP